MSRMLMLSEQCGATTTQHGACTSHALALDDSTMTHELEFGSRAGPGPGGSGERALYAICERYRPIR